MIKPVFPILIYDDLCYSCTKFAKLANMLVQGRALVVGHYSLVGKEIKKELFPNDYQGLEMFWFIIDGHAYGGRAGLARVVEYIFTVNKPPKHTYENNEFDLKSCTTDCATVKGVFFRSCSILTRYKKFEIAARHGYTPQ